MVYSCRTRKPTLQELLCTQISFIRINNADNELLSLLPFQCAGYYHLRHIHRSKVMKFFNFTKCIREHNECFHYIRQIRSFLDLYRVTRVNYRIFLERKTHYRIRMSLRLVSENVKVPNIFPVLSFRIYRFLSCPPFLYRNKLFIIFLKDRPPPFGHFLSAL